MLLFDNTDYLFLSIEIIRKGGIGFLLCIKIIAVLTNDKLNRIFMGKYDNFYRFWVNAIFGFRNSDGVVKADHCARPVACFLRVHQF